MRRDITESEAEAIIVVAAEHFANFFMNNMPVYCIGMADRYEGPIEDPEWLKLLGLRYWVTLDYQSELLPKSCRGLMWLFPKNGSLITVSVCHLIFLRLSTKCRLYRPISIAKALHWHRYTEHGNLAKRFVEHVIRFRKNSNCWCRWYFSLASDSWFWKNQSCVGPRIYGSV